MVMDLNTLYNTYLASRKHLGTIGDYQSPTHDPNSNMTEISQNGQTDQLDPDHIHDAVGTKDARLGSPNAC